MSIDNLKKEAKRWLKALRAGATDDARTRLERAYPAAREPFTLRAIQHALARERGFESWKALMSATGSAKPSLETYEQLVRDLLLAFNSKDEAALARLNAHYTLTFTFDDLWAQVWRLVYGFRQRAFGSGGSTLELEEARTMVAQHAGFGGWAALTESLTTGAPPVPPFEVDRDEKQVSPRRPMSAGEWDSLLGELKEHRLTRLNARGVMTDAMLARLADCDHITALDLGGSRMLTDDGLLVLARMPQLEELYLNEYPGGTLTDRGLAVLNDLPNLRIFEMTWQRGITDAGAVNLQACDRLERVDLMGTPTGDDVIRALQGKTRLHHLQTGKLLTDAGLGLLPGLPILRTWSQPTRLLIDGTFSDEGLRALALLEGLADLDVFWHVTGITADAFRHLSALPRLERLAADGALSNDAAMPHIAAIPRLRGLRIQETPATDEGFEALSRSNTLEQLWARRCEHLGSRGFLALSKMPALRNVGANLANVSDNALSSLPDFPALRELTPVGAQDAGFAHIGRCQQLERLSCMYCRDTTDVATAHIAGLRQLRSYYAGLTKITDASLEILGRMESLEEIKFYQCMGVTDAGLPFLAGLPKLRRFNVSGTPGVTLQGTRVFPPRVRVKYST